MERSGPVIYFQLNQANLEFSAILVSKMSGGSYGMTNVEPTIIGV